jgi:threonine aldolase
MTAGAGGAEAGAAGAAGAGGAAEAGGAAAEAGGEVGRDGGAGAAAHRRGFASDNYAGVLPQVLEAITAANGGHAVSYGGDEWTARVEGLFRDHFGPEATTALVFNGTGANVVALQALTRPYEACICASTAHLNVDECGAPERVAGLKLLTVDTPDGKLTPALVEPRLVRFGDEHAVQPRVVSITQSTELGTLYTADEIAALADQAHERGMLLHIDGARLSNAAAALDVPLRAITTDAGADAVSFGGTKNGMLLGEAVVFLRAGLGGEVAFLRKQSMQLASKMRFLAAQFEALLTDWRTPAAHANAMAARLAGAVARVDGVEITQRVEANAVFAVLPAAATAWLQERWRFYVWNETTGEVRWMCSWDTTEDDVDAFAADLAEALRVA